jgi:hypothetical protein
MNQRRLFDAYREPLVDLPRPTDPNVTEKDKPRLKGQNAAILERLKLGPATNDELSRIARKYTSRISDIRAAGHKVICERAQDGLCWYRLEE